MLSITIVDFWLLYKGVMTGRDGIEPNDFLSTLVEELKYTHFYPGRN